MYSINIVGLIVSSLKRKRSTLMQQSKDICHCHTCFYLGRASRLYCPWCYKLTRVWILGFEAISLDFLESQRICIFPFAVVVQHMLAQLDEFIASLLVFWFIIWINHLVNTLTEMWVRAQVWYQCNTFFFLNCSTGLHTDNISCEPSCIWWHFEYSMEMADSTSTDENCYVIRGKHPT